MTDHQVLKQIAASLEASLQQDTDPWRKYKDGRKYSNPWSSHIEWKCDEAQALHQLKSFLYFVDSLSLHYMLNIAKASKLILHNNLGVNFVYKTLQRTLTMNNKQG